MIKSIENNSTKNGENMEIEKKLKERAERNRQKALLLKRSKVVTHPYMRYVSCIYIYIYIYMIFKNNLFINSFLTT